MLVRAVIFAIVGVALELAFTGARAALNGDRFGTGRSYLWMFVGYGAGGTLLDLVHREVAASALVVAPVYLLIIYVVEAVYGSALRVLLDAVPWEYTEGLHWHGLVRLDYAPFWFSMALAFNAFSNWLTAHQL